MQPRQHIHAHGHPGDEVSVQAFRRNLAILRRFGNGHEQRRLNEPEIDIGNPLGHPDIRVVRRARMGRRALGKLWGASKHLKTAIFGRHECQCCVC